MSDFFATELVPYEGYPSLMQLFLGAERLLPSHLFTNPLAHYLDCVSS